MSRTGLQTGDLDLEGQIDLETKKCLLSEKAF